MSEQEQAEKPAYTAPKLTVVGSIHELTEASKVFGASDGFAMIPGSLVRASP